jgi:dolichol-phosphate mannosyltransferase
MKSISIIIPIYNEEKTIEPVMKRLISLDLPLEKEIIIIDDGSDKETINKIKRIEKENPKENIRILLNEKNMGKGYSIRKGFKEAKGDLIVVQDADLEYDFNDIKKIVDEMKKNPSLKVIYGSRFLKSNNRGKILFYLGNKFLSLFTSLLYSNKITDMETCYKCFRKEVIKNMSLESNGFDIEPEMTAKILKKGIKIKEIPINYYPRSFEDGKKIKISDGFHAIKILLKYKFSSKF